MLTAHNLTYHPLVRLGKCHEQSGQRAGLSPTLKPLPHLARQVTCLLSIPYQRSIVAQKGGKRHSSPA